MSQSHVLIVVSVQTLRVQSPEGTVRVDMVDSDMTSQLFERVHDEFNLASFAFALFRDRARREEVISSKSRRLRDLGLHHGDMLYLTPVNGAVLFEQPTTSAEVTYLLFLVDVPFRLSFCSKFKILLNTYSVSP